MASILSRPQCVKNLARPPDAGYFEYEYEKCAIDFLTEYDNGNAYVHPNIGLEFKC